MSFRPSLLSTLVLAALAVVFWRLGSWQMERSHFKQALLNDFADAPALSALPAEDQAPAFARVSLSGEWEGERHFLLDNQVLSGRPGVHVLSPFRVADGSLLLVNRGWLPMAPDRRSLPTVPETRGPASLSGHLEALRTPGKRLGEEQATENSPWPRLVTWPDLDEMAGALGEPVYPKVLYLKADHPAGFEGRNWSPVVMGPKKHRAYAVQWYALCLTALVAWIVLAMRRKTT